MAIADIRRRALALLTPPLRLRSPEWSGVLRTVRSGMLAACRHGASNAAAFDDARPRSARRA